LSLHYEIIFNPTAGKGAAKGRINEIRLLLDSCKLDYQIHVTREPGHGMDLAQSFATIPDTAIVAAGGDGTCNEVINGLMRRPETAPPPIFGVIPMGRGNDFAYGVGIPGDPALAIPFLADERLLKLDIGKVTGGDFPDGRWFGNGVGVGFDAIVGFEAAGMKHVHGPFAYSLAALKTLARYPAAPRVEFSVNGVGSRIEPALISIMNGRRMGGAFYMAPDGNPHDGRLNWCHTNQGSRLKLLAAMAAYIKGKQSEREDTRSGHATTISIRAIRGGLAVHADGETICKAGIQLDINIEPGALRLIGSRGD
jgi:diacylglycerol kinase (ATP)